MSAHDYISTLFFELISMTHTFFRTQNHLHFANPRFKLRRGHMFYLSLTKLQIINYEAVKKCKVSWSSRQVYRCKFYPNRLQAAYVVFKTFNLLWLSVTLSLFTFYFLNFQSLQFIFSKLAEVTHLRNSRSRSCVNLLC